jgi:pilus assembly protein CpaF
MPKFDLGPLQQLIDDASVSEIMINGAQRVFAEKDGKKVLTDVKFASEEELFRFVQTLFAADGKRVDTDVPFADLCLHDGTRVNAIIPPLVRAGVSVTMRKFSKKINSLDDLIQGGALTQRAADLLIGCIRGKVNIIFSGGTGAGKTTLLQMLASFFPKDERVVVIEDVAELKINQDNLVSLETRTAGADGKGQVTIRDLIRNALRMTPDRIVVGEVRGGEALDMLQAMATGHSGTIGIVHGNSPKDVIARLEAMTLMSGVQLPLWEVRKLIASTVHLVVHVERLQDGSRKVTYITEVRGIEREEIVLNDLFVYNFEKLDAQGKVLGQLKSSIRYYPLFFNKLQKMGLLEDTVFVSD